ncbi:MAG: class I ribonucleotide reductase maintenance protein YfaE [Pseudomonadota bacterium]|nr:class I ribonucleotide reductase maintenance protein YfaE [Pseudomonadota bacterium]
MSNARKAARIGRRRWASRTFHSDAQTEMELTGGSTTQLEMDLGELPLLVGSSAVAVTPLIHEPQEQVDFFDLLAESPEPTPQTIFEGMEKPVFAVSFADGRTARFQHANTLLESFEAQNIHIEYQCREGYCGSCRVRLQEGDVHYTEEPMAWIDDDEILPCCCIPTSDLKLQ